MILYFIDVIFIELLLLSLLVVSRDAKSVTDVWRRQSIFNHFFCLILALIDRLRSRIDSMFVVLIWLIFVGFFFEGGGRLICIGGRFPPFDWFTRTGWIGWIGWIERSGRVWPFTSVSCQLSGGAAFDPFWIDSSRFDSRSGAWIVVVVVAAAAGSGDVAVVAVVAVYTRGRSPQISW